MIRAGLILSMVLLMGCEGSRKLSNQNLAYLYTPTLNLVFPEYRICNIHPDTSRVFFSIHPEELLFMKSSEAVFFSASIAISFNVLYNYESKTPVDSGTFYFDFEQDTIYVGPKRGYIDVFAPDSSDYIIQLVLTDLNRQQAVAAFHIIDRTGIQPAQDFMVVDAETDQPYISDFTNRNLSVKLLNTNSSRNGIYMRYFNGRYPLSKPPFSDDLNKPLSYRADKSYYIDFEKGVPIVLDQPGIYHFQYDTLIKEGLTLFRFEEDFPRLTSADNLIESIRFLTTREEYDKILVSTDKKQAVDEYWLSMAGNRERARVLIKSYYSRVQHANNFFTSYLEGWKTDRGLIYIIFGPPSSIYRNIESESWNYSQINNYGPLSFTFDKINNPFSSNDYQLRRSSYYELPWYKAVDSWRDGRVVNDSY